MGVYATGYNMESINQHAQDTLIQYTSTETSKENWSDILQPVTRGCWAEDLTNFLRWISEPTDKDSEQQNLEDQR